MSPSPCRNLRWSSLLSRSAPSWPKVPSCGLSAGVCWLAMDGAPLEQPQQHFAYLVRIRPRSQTPGQEGNEAVASRRKSLNSATSHLQRSDRFSCGGLRYPGAFLCAAGGGFAAMMCEPERIVAAPTPESSADRLAPRSRNAGICGRTRNAKPTDWSDCVAVLLHLFGAET